MMAANGTRWTATGPNGPQDFTAPLYIVDNSSDAQRVHIATGHEVWCPDGWDVSLEDQPSDREIIVAGPDMRHHAMRWADAGRDVLLFLVPAPSHDDPRIDKGDVLAAIEVADEPQQRTRRDTPLTLPTQRETAAQAMVDVGTEAERRATLTGATQKLEHVLSGTVSLARNAAHARQKIEKDYAGITVRADAAPWATNAEVESAVARERRKIRRSARHEFGLDFLPSTRHHEFERPESTYPIPYIVSPHIAVTGAQGLGKTTMLVGGHGQSGLLHGCDSMFTLMLFPTMEKAEESAASYRDNMPAVSDVDKLPPAYKTVRGRSAADPDSAEEDARMCVRYKEAEWRAQRGESVNKMMCQGCPVSDKCAYQKQKADITRLTNIEQNPQGVVVFASHAYLTTPMPGAAQSDLLVIDESPSKVMVKEAALTLDELRTGLPPHVLQGQDVAVIADMQANNDAMQAEVWPLLDILAAQTPKNGAQERSIDLGAIRAAGYTSERLWAIIGVMAAHCALAGTDRYPGDDAVEGDAGDTTPSAVRRLMEVVRALRIEIDNQVDTAVAVLWRIEQSGPRKGVFSLKVWRMAVARYRTTPSIYLDGTADMTLACIEQGNMTHYDIQSPRRCKLFHVPDKSMSNQSITGHRAGEKGKNESQSLRLRLRTCIARYPGAFVATSKPVRAVLDLDSLDCRPAHFGALRGLDTFKDCPTGFILGRSRPPPAALEDMVRAHAACAGRHILTMAQVEADMTRDHPERRTYLSGGLLGYPTVITDKAGRCVKVNIERHPDTLVEAMRRQLCEAENEQAIDRMRLHHCDTERTVIVFGSYLSSKPDSVIPWREFWAVHDKLAHIAQSKGFLPLSSREAARVMPEIVGGKDAAAELIKKVQSDPSLLSDYPIKTLIGYPDNKDQVFEVAYKASPGPDQTRTRAVNAIVWAATEAEVRAKIEAHLGPLQSFKVLLSDAQFEEDAEDEAEMAAQLEAQLSADVALPDTQEQPTRPALAAHDLCLTLHTNLQRIAAPPSVARLASRINKITAALKRAEQRRANP